MADDTDDLLDPTTDSASRTAIMHPRVAEYITRLHSPLDQEVLLEMEALAEQNDFPIIGRPAGAFLRLMAKSIGAKRIFEFGSGFGYSAFWFSDAVGEDGKVICVEGDENNTKLAEKFLTKAGRWNRVEYHTAFAQDVFAKTAGKFDLIYNDADKGDYPSIWKMSRDRIRPGGLYIVDNVLWRGRVAMENVIDDVVEGWTDAIREHNAEIASDGEFEFCLNPIRDGLVVARRKG